MLILQPLTFRQKSLNGQANQLSPRIDFNLGKRIFFAESQYPYILDISELRKDCVVMVMHFYAIILFYSVTIHALHTTKHHLDQDWSYVPDTGNYTCDELTRWLGTEKHYSNKNREVLFGLNEGDENCKKQPVLLLHDVKFGRATAKGAASYFRTSTIKGKSNNDKQVVCQRKDNNVVAYLSNFSINNNFSHFLHGLLRLFCALIDAKWIVWDDTLDIPKFVVKVEYTIWLDEYFKLDENKLKWLSAMGGSIYHLGKNLPASSSGSCAYAKNLIYGSGCVKLLPPEKWFGYPGCRAGDVLPAFGSYMRQQFDAPGVKELFLIDYEINNVERLKKEKILTSRIGERKDDNDNNQSHSGGIRVAFAQRDVGTETGKRIISNLDKTQKLLQHTQHIRTITENVTFEHFNVKDTVKYMAKVRDFIPLSVWLFAC